MSSAIDRLKVQLSAAKVNGPYGKVTYADPKNKKYPINTAARVRAAWAYINVAKNAAVYPLNGVTVSEVKAAIESAAKRFGVTLNA